MDRFLSIEAFVAVAEAQSFAEAARHMHVSKSVITTRVQQLEEFIGAPLFHRNTRNVRLSELGQAYLKDSANLVGKTIQLVDQMRELKGALVGRLKIHALPGFVLGNLASCLVEFQEKYEDIMLDLFVNDAVIDPIKEGYDCALQIFEPVSEELVGRRVCPIRRVFCATPEYLERHGTPSHPRDLYGHRLGLYSGYPTRERWIFHGDTGPVALDLKPVMQTNSVNFLKEYACLHSGIVCIPTVVAARPLLDGTLTAVLTDWQLPLLWLLVVYARTQRSNTKLRLFMEHLFANFAGEPSWDRALVERSLLQASHVDTL